MQGTTSADPGVGRYLVPDHRGKDVVERSWDGAVWLGDVAQAPPNASLPGYHRRLFGFLSGSGWKLLLGLVVCLGAASALWATDRDAKWVSGVQLALPLFSIGATALMMSAFLHFLNRRVRFDRIPREVRTSIFRWGVLSGVVGVAFALGVELGLPAIFGDTLKDDPGWSVLAGPAEETGKLIIPVILWLKMRHRIPREGYLLVLISASTFGVLEGFEYALNPENFQPARPLAEIMHPLFTGFVAVVAWRAAYKGPSIFTGAAFGAWVVAMIAHSGNDLAVLDPSDPKAFGAVTPAVILIMFLLQKHAARQLVPPDNVGAVSPRWRPRAPKHAEVVPNGGLDSGPADSAADRRRVAEPVG